MSQTVETGAGHEEEHSSVSPDPEADRAADPDALDPEEDSLGLSRAASPVTSSCTAEYPSVSASSHGHAAPHASLASSGSSVAAEAADSPVASSGSASLAPLQPAAPPTSEPRTHL